MAGRRNPRGRRRWRSRSSAGQSCSSGCCGSRRRVAPRWSSTAPSWRSSARARMAWPRTRSRRHAARRRAQGRRDPGGGATDRDCARGSGSVSRFRSIVARARRFGILAAARFGPIGGRYRDAWVLMDRVFTASDNAERLFDYVRSNRPDINAWFVVERGTNDWARLYRAGERRLIAYGSWRWKVLMLRCSWVVTSHIDDTSHRPGAARRARRSPDMAVRLPPAWRDHVRSLVMAQHEGRGSVRHQHGRRARVHRGRWHQVPLHRPRVSQLRSAAVRPAAGARPSRP